MRPYTISILLELRILESKSKVEAGDLVDKDLDAVFGTGEDANVERK